MIPKSVIQLCNNLHRKREPKSNFKLSDIGTIRIAILTVISFISIALLIWAITTNNPLASDEFAVILGVLGDFSLGTVGNLRGRELFVASLVCIIFALLIWGIISISLSPLISIDYILAYLFGLVFVFIADLAGI